MENTLGVLAHVSIVMTLPGCRPGARQPPPGGSGGAWGVLRLALVVWMTVVVGEVVKMLSTAHGIDKPFKSSDGKFNVRVCLNYEPNLRLAAGVVLQ